jgi:hypothetical protein
VGIKPLFLSTATCEVAGAAFVKRGIDLLQQTAQIQSFTTSIKQQQHGSDFTGNGIVIIKG